MFYLGLRDAIMNCEELWGEKITLTELAKRTGIARKTLSRLVNHPSENISVQHLANLAEFFFQETVSRQKRAIERGELSRSDPALNHRKLMEGILHSLFQVYPEAPEYKSVVPDFLGASIEANRITPNLMWGFYEEKYHPEFVEERNAKRRQLLVEQAGEKQNKSKGPIKTESKKK